MKFCLLLIALILLSFNANAWQSYQNGLGNAGVSDGTGHFPLKTANFSDSSLGMDFQPLVGDLDNNGNNEIVVFSNESLIVFNLQLGILAQAKIGSILGQPALFNFDNDGLIEVIFNARQGNDYFFAYQLNNSGLRQEFNLTLANEADFGGIKCLNLDDAKSCVFKDRKNHIHIINLASKTDSSYATSAYEEYRQTVPAIGDLDNDGNMEAVFWLNEDNSSGYGLLAFDLVNRNVKWKVDNMFSPLILGSSLSHQLFELKGQPVLADLDNDDKLEIAASVFYDDSFNADTRSDWFTELLVYGHDGAKLFSRCETNVFSSVGCNDGISSSEKWEGSNPFAMDFNKDGANDICFIKDVKTTSGSSRFSHMALSCYNHSGGETANIKLESIGDIKGTSAAADMNNDGRYDIITTNSINLANGTLLLFLPLNTTSPIAADIDGNKGLDLIWTKDGQTKAYLDNLNYGADLSVDEITFSRISKTHVNVTAIIKNNGEVGADNVKTVIYNTKTLENKTAILNIKKNASFSSVLALKENEQVLVNADYSNEINESNEDNNVMSREFIDLPHVFVSADNLEPSNIQPEFRSYIKNRLISGYYTENENEADVKVYIGKNNPNNQVNNIKTLDEFEFGYDFGNVFFNDKVGANPYAALVGAFKDTDGKVKVMIAGNEIEGDIIGVKKFIENQALLLNVNDKEAVFIDDEDVDAVKVYDYLHLGGNIEHYNLNNGEFKKIVKNALNNEMFNVFDKEIVTGNGITLRLRNLKPNISNDYLEYLSSNGMPVELPVVLAHGLFSNLTTWEVLGAEISNTGRDTWLIEITGGPGQDCDGCIDYTFYNLTDIFVPALLNGVLTFTNKDKLQYVGFSNGCRAALDSLERKQFDSNKVETFVAVGCPGSFEGNSDLGNLISSKNGEISKRLDSKNLVHPSVSEIIVVGLFNKDYIATNPKLKISLNLWKFYENIITFNNDTQPGNINFSNFAIIQGTALTSNDGIVTIDDENKIFDNINRNNNPKKHFSIFALHNNLDTSQRTKSIINKLLNKQQLSFYERTINLINQSG